ncbi:hypothetical protein PUN28_009992 [Cardiocondyla obscurior]|uniref:Little elongation complex subunit 2 C-terminal domain-containing protein n=1 Tax=Cardiocondyla obscurior TaxID=286306 RepID=A0AAW2FND3_9HYME
MEKFRNLDWHPPLDDMIDNVFINDTRMEAESAMYRIMNDNLINPFEDIENEYADVNVELIKKYLCEDAETGMENESQPGVKIKRPYVPGIRTLPFNFPRYSHLNMDQHAMCLRVLLKLSSNENKMISEEERQEFEEYMALQKIISEEQKEFLEFAKSKWCSDFNWAIKSMKFIETKWKTKVKRFEKLPRYYIESMNMPLSVQDVNYQNKDIKVTFKSCLHQGIFSKVKLPNLDQKQTLHIDPVMLSQKYPSYETPNPVTQHFKLPVSEDSYCESLAKEAEADFVISSSGLKCLLNNINPEHSKPWLIPVVVKSHQGKNIVYVDKKLPPSKATIPEKNTWVYKYVLRYHFVDIKNDTLEKTEHTSEIKSEKDANNENLESDDNLFNDYLKNYEEDLYLSDIDETNNLASDKIDSHKIEEQNVSYNLFTIGPMESQHEQIKIGVKDYQMLVRTKSDGIETSSNEESQTLLLAPKMEHQLMFGAEAVTIEEGLHQWASLKFRPETSLARVRIETNTSEIIQIERCTTTSLSKELKRLYNIKVENSLNILHNIIKGLSSLTPGQYIMRYVPLNGPFAYVYKQAEYRQNCLDLHNICKLMLAEKFYTIPKTPWPPIDNMVTTPMIRCFQRMPAMYLPKRPRGRPKKYVYYYNIKKKKNTKLIMLEF